LARPAVHGTFSQPGPSRPAAAVRLARTLGVKLNYLARHMLPPIFSCSALLLMMGAAIDAHAVADTQSTERVQLTVCYAMPKLLAGALPEQDANYRVQPAAAAHDFGISNDGAKFSLNDEATERLVVRPKHGKLLNRASTKGWPYALYVPNAGFVGQDLVVFDVDGEDSQVGVDLKLRVKFQIKVTAEPLESYLGQAGERLQRKYCPNPVSEQVPR
jgi:hypothetical protein